jgi:hypothetical protein
MTERWLNEIANADGVNGVFIATGRGKVLQKVGFKEEDSELELLVVRILRILGAFYARGQNVTEIELYWQDHYANCRHSNNLLLITLCRTPKVISYLRITLNVALANILEDKKIMKQVKNHATDRTLILSKNLKDATETQLIAKVRSIKT